MCPAAPFRFGVFVAGHRVLVPARVGRYAEGREPPVVDNPDAELGAAPDPVPHVLR